MSRVLWRSNLTAARPAPAGPHVIRLPERVTEAAYFRLQPVRGKRPDHVCFDCRDVVFLAEESLTGLVETARRSSVTLLTAPGHAEDKLCRHFADHLRLVRVGEWEIIG